MTRRTDISAGLFVALVSALLLVWIIPVNTSPPQSESNLSPAFLPSVAAATMLVLSLLMVVSRLLLRRHVEEGVHEEFGAEARGIGWSELRDIAIWSAFAAAMIAGYTTVGFLLTSIPALALMLYFTGERHLVTIAATALLTPTLLYLIAWHAFSVQLP